MNHDLEIWENAASGWDSIVATKDSFRTALITDALEKIINNAEGLVALDAGCGNGYFSSWLVNKGVRVKGLDGALEMVKLARRSYPNLEFVHHDLLTTLTDSDNSYDLILANMLFMHMNNINVFLKEAQRLLKPNGQLIFSVLHPAFNQPVSRLYKNLWQKLIFANPDCLTHDYYGHTSERFESTLGSKLPHYHRTMEDYSLELAKTGFAIKQIVEPHRLPESLLKTNPKLEYALRLPRFIFFNCITI